MSEVHICRRDRCDGHPMVFDTGQAIPDPGIFTCMWNIQFEPGNGTKGGGESDAHKIQTGKVLAFNGEPFVQGAGAENEEVPGAKVRQRDRRRRH